MRWHTDDAISGTRTANRPAFQEMIATATDPRRRDFPFVVVYDVKRFGRLDNDEAGYYRHMLRSAGVEVRYVSESFDGGDTDDLLRPVKQWQARQESKDLSKVTIRGQLTRVRGGVWMGGTPPLGYDLRYESDRGEFLFVLRFEPDGSKRILAQDGVLQRTLERGESITVSKRDVATLTRSDPERVEATITNLLDNLSDATRDLAEERLAELRIERNRLARRAEELDRLSLSEARVREATHEIGVFLAGLEHTLRNSPGEHRKAAIRKCVSQIMVTEPGGAIELRLNALPVPAAQTSKETITIDARQTTPA